MHLGATLVYFKNNIAKKPLCSGKEANLEIKNGYYPSIKNRIHFY